MTISTDSRMHTLRLALQAQFEQHADELTTLTMHRAAPERNGLDPQTIVALIDSTRRAVADTLAIVAGGGEGPLSPDGTVLATSTDAGTVLRNVADPAHPRRIGVPLPGRWLRSSGNSHDQPSTLPGPSVSMTTSPRPGTCRSRLT